MIKTVLKWFGYTVITMEETIVFHEGIVKSKSTIAKLEASFSDMYEAYTTSNKRNTELSKERQKTMQDAIDQIDMQDALIKSQTDTISKLTKELSYQKSTALSLYKELESYRATEVVKDAFKDLGKSMGI